jgi:hypothetical protein
MQTCTCERNMENCLRTYSGELYSIKNEEGLIDAKEELQS